MAEGMVAAPPTGEGLGNGAVAGRSRGRDATLRSSRPTSRGRRSELSRDRPDAPTRDSKYGPVIDLLSPALRQNSAAVRRLTVAALPQRWPAKPQRWQTACQSVTSGSRPETGVVTAFALPNGFRFGVHWLTAIAWAPASYLPLD